MGAALCWMCGVLLCSVIQHTSGLRLPACSGDHDAVELRESVAGEQAVCENIAHDQMIQILLDDTLLATCRNSSQSCYNVSPILLTATRGSTTITATISKAAVRVNGINPNEFTCRPGGESGVSCPIDTVYAPSANEVSCSFSTSDSGTVTVSCTVSKAYSALNRYTCDVRKGDGSGPSLGRSSYSSGGSSSSDYVSGTCSLSFAAPTSSGTYSSYTVIVYPGVTAYHAVHADNAVNGSLNSTVSIGHPNVNYRVNATTLRVNDGAKVTVNENEAVTLVCESYGHPSPDLDLLQRGALLARQDGGSATVERSQLTHTVTARCDNTGNVTCLAGNLVGEGQIRSVTLHVNCKPRSRESEPDVPNLNFITKPLTASFQLVAFPLPRTFTFHYLGQIQGFDRSYLQSQYMQSVPASVKLDATCTNTFADYAVRCDVTVSSVNDSSAGGFYSFTAANAFGEERLAFLLRVNETEGTGVGFPSEGVTVGQAVWVSVVTGLSLAVAVVIHLADF